MQSTFVPGTRRLARTGVFQRTTPSRLVVLAKESRVGNKSIPVPKGVEVTINGNSIKVKVSAV